jgi:hypothetical protein
LALLTRITENNIFLKVHDKAEWVPSLSPRKIELPACKLHTDREIKPNMKSVNNLPFFKELAYEKFTQKFSQYLAMRDIEYNIQ